MGDDHPTTCVSVRRRCSEGPTTVAPGTEFGGARRDIPWVMCAALDTGDCQGSGPCLLQHQS